VDVVINELENSFRFPGQIVDAESGLYYNWHRFYDPETGRYISADPIGFYGGDVNLYAYVWSDPINWVDTAGLTAIPITGSGGAVAGSPTSLEDSKVIARGLKAGFDRVCYYNQVYNVVRDAALHIIFQKPTGEECDVNCDDGDYTDPQDLEEQLALDEAKAGEGESFMGDKVNDPRYKDTHDKMRHNHPHPDGTNTEIHYWKNRDTGETSGFKFKNHPNSRKRRY
jgi:RHS repeat-associated protein